MGYEKYPEVPQYFQQDDADVRYGGWRGTVATHGCGITAMSMLATYMTDTELTPAVMAPRFWNYSSDGGTSYYLFDEAPGALGFYLEKRAYYWNEVEQALKNGQMVVSLQFADHFTTTAHFIVLTGLTEDGRVLIMDSNVYNHTGRFANTDWFEKGFDPAYVHVYNRIYWIYEKKLIRTPGCDRCADPSVETLDLCLEPYYCPRCRDLLNRQAGYRAALDSMRKAPEM